MSATFLDLNPPLPLVSLKRLDLPDSGVQEGTILRVHVGEVRSIHIKLQPVGLGTFLGDA